MELAWIKYETRPVELWSCRQLHVFMRSKVALHSMKKIEFSSLMPSLHS